MIDVPVLVFCYNRPQHFKRMMEALENNVCCEEFELHIFSDAAKKQSDFDKVNEVRSIVMRVKETSKFRNVVVHAAEQNKGLAKSIISGVSELIEKSGAVIVLEDDLITTHDFLLYMRSALDYFKNNEKIWAISGYSFLMPVLQNYSHDIFLTGRGCSWGWGTWKDRWNTVDWDVKDYNEFRRNKKAVHKFSLDGLDQPFILDACMEGRNHSWAIRWCYSACKQNKYTVYPVQSRVSNIGTDGSGTNFSRRITKYDTSIDEQIKECKFEDITIDDTIRKQFSKKFMSRLAWIKHTFIFKLKHLKA